MGYIDTPETLQANRKFIRKAMKADMLEAEHELKLARRWREHGDQEALHELVTAYIRLVVSMATKFRSYGLPLGDMVQEGCIGLMQAAARFEPAREVRFSTYASWWIRSSIQDFILRNWSIVRTGTTAAQKSLFFNLRRLKAQIERTEGGKINESMRSKIADALRVSERDVDMMSVRLSGGDKSLNDPVGESGDGELQDFLPDDSASPEEIALAGRDAEVRTGWIEQAMQDLTKREQTIIRERRLAEEGLTLAALGERLGISKERVRQIEHEALGKLKQSITRQVGDPILAGLITE
ncbi:MAG: RNA polymerase factor sigma-32 [Proteobacteria bacterium]|nr:RNA polymerase factor sigma-32 [Pseudomonadota bacterium]